MSKFLLLSILLLSFVGSASAQTIPLRSSYECRNGGDIYLFDKLIKFSKRKIKFQKSIAKVKASIVVENKLKPKDQDKIASLKAILKELKLTLASLSDCAQGNLSELVFNQLAGNYSGAYNAGPASFIPFDPISGTVSMVVTQVGVNSNVDLVFDETFANAVGSNAYTFSFSTAGLELPGQIGFTHPEHGEILVTMTDQYNVQFTVNGVNGTPYNLEFYFTFNANYTGFSGVINAYIGETLIAQGNITMSKN